VDRGSGSAGYHPALLLGLLVNGYTTGVFSSRKLERATYDSVAFRFIAPPSPARCSTSDFGAAEFGAAPVVEGGAVITVPLGGAGRTTDGLPNA
jgi:hypothetical protein